MRNLFLFLRRIAGILAWLFGGSKARETLRELKKLDISRYGLRVVSDAVLLNEIPSPTLLESSRMEFIQTRLGEFGVSNVFADDWGNVLAMFPAHGLSRDFLLVVAEVGDENYSAVENSVALSWDRATGQGLGERSVGAAALLVFAEFAQKTGFHLDKNLLLVFTTSSSIDEKEGAFRHFLGGWADRIACGVVVRGTGLGAVETRYVGSYRMSVSVQTEERHVLSTGRSASAAVILAAIGSELGRIGLSEETGAVSLARMEAGAGFGHWATQGELDVEIVAEDNKTLERLRHEVVEAVGRVAETLDPKSVKVETVIRFKRSAGDPELNAPLTGALYRALAKTGIKAQTSLVTEKVSLLNEKGIPAVALGVSSLVRRAKEEAIELDSVALGFRQLLLVIEEADDAIRRQPG